MRKKFTAAILAFVMIASLPFNLSIGYGDANVASNVSVLRYEIQAATASLKVEQADEETTQKLHKKLMKGDAVTLKVKGSSKEAKNLVNSLKEQIKFTNKQGVVFCGSMGKTSGKYTSYNISKDEAKSYKYAVKFIEKLFSKYKSQLYKNETTKNYIEDYKKYPDEAVLKLRILYDDYVSKLLAREYTDTSFAGYDERTTTSSFYCDSKDADRVYFGDSKLLLNVVYTVTYTYDNGLVRTAEFVMDNLNDYPDMSQDTGEPVGANCISYTYVRKINLKSFDEFSANPEAQELSGLLKLYGNTTQTLAANTENFCDLSDAMKVFVVADSKYFDCRMSKNGYGMVYKYIYFGKFGGDGMKTLYDNKAEGVCQVYASYECQVWDYLGFKNYFCSNHAINHAWTVVKVKNSDGKVMWIPFDYGIGPADGLAVSASVRKKYLKTEAMRYKLYLSGIKGAPKKKNFSDKDFK